MGQIFKAWLGLQGWQFLTSRLSLTSAEIACLPMWLWYRALKIHSERDAFWKDSHQVPVRRQGLGLMQSLSILSLAHFEFMELSGATPSDSCMYTGKSHVF